MDAWEMASIGGAVLWLVKNVREGKAESRKQLVKQYLTLTGLGPQDGNPFVDMPTNLLGEYVNIHEQLRKYR